MAWTPERADSLEQMWLWGIHSTSIAHNLGEVTRNAVMGRINRSGLMGRGGERLGRELSGAVIDRDAAREAVETLLHEGCDEGRSMHRHALVAVSCLLVGKAPSNIAKALGMDRHLVEASITALHDTDVWRHGEPPPAAWWHHEEGAMAFMLDMMAADGMILLSDTDRHGGRTYSRVPEQQDGTPT